MPQRPPKPPPRHAASTPRQVRIIGGDYRRSLLPVPDLPGLRPTPDRVRETLFNWLRHLWNGDFASRRVLDLFAGSGALGMEAASRGAGHVTLVEADRRAARLLLQNRDRLGATRVMIHHGDAAAFLRRDEPPYDLILLDPPFDTDWLARLLPTLAGHLTAAGFVYTESGTPPVAPAGWVVVREGRAGSVYYGLLAPDLNPNTAGGFAATQKREIIHPG
ncbi:MAG: 16S rRNA (guanine(966)-N(2))-methyltransferase RsmD [Pigmentiphaga sp.]|nr:16S rRNA (guanine(966)-N(2))-methyltransferase RsmD [Pigmentiphaga sp.]